MTRLVGGKSWKNREKWKNSKESSHSPHANGINVGIIAIPLHYTPSSFSSFCVAGGIPPRTLQLFEAYCAEHRFSSPVHLQRHSTSDGMRGLY
jgi:hypothetical protein